MTTSNQQTVIASNKLTVTLDVSTMDVTFNSGLTTVNANSYLTNEFVVQPTENLLPAETLVVIFQSTGGTVTTQELTLEMREVTPLTETQDVLNIVVGEDFTPIVQDTTDTSTTPTQEYFVQIPQAIMENPGVWSFSLAIRAINDTSTGQFTQIDTSAVYNFTVLNSLIGAGAGGTTPNTVDIANLYATALQAVEDATAQAEQAEQSATNAETSATNAQASATSAEQSATQSQASADSASQFASNAEASASSAEESATQSQASAVSSANSSAQSSTSAQEAQASASLAEQSATNAQQSAVDAEYYANIAQQVASGTLRKNFDYQSVEDLPPIGEEQYIYMIPIAGASGNNTYDEYVWAEDKNAYEKIGSTATDLSGYAQINGTYPNMTVGNATNATNAQTAQSANTATSATAAQTATKALQDGNGDVIADTYLKKTFLQNLFFERTGTNTANIVDTQPSVATGNYLELTTNNTAFDFNSANKIVATRVLENDIELSNAQGLTMILSFAFSRNASVEIAGRAFIDGVKIADEQAFAYLQYSGGSTFTTTNEITLVLRLNGLINPQTFTAGQTLTVELFTRQNSGVTLTTRYFCGVNVQGANRYCTIGIAVAGTTINTNQITDGAVTKPKLSADVQASLLPTVTTANSGQVATVDENGNWVAGDLPSGTNLVDLGELTPTSSTTFTGTITAENYAKLATPNTVVKVTISNVVAYGLVNCFNLNPNSYYTTAITRSDPTVTTIITLEVTQTQIIGTFVSVPVTPVPTSSDNGKILGVNSSGQFALQPPPSPGTTVVANPTLSGDEPELTGLEVDGVTYQLLGQDALISRVEALPETVDNSTPDILAVGYEENTQFYLKLSPVPALVSTPSIVSLQTANGSSWSDQSAVVTMSGGDGSPYNFSLSTGTFPQEISITQNSSGNTCNINITANGQDVTASTYSATLTCTCGSQTLDIPIELVVDTCLTGDTLITMANGTRKRIDEIKVGDKVLSFNPSTGLLQPDLVYSADSHLTKTHDHYDRYEFDDGTVIKVVHRHRFYNVDKQRMLHLDCWEIGDRAFKQNGSTVRLVKAQPHYEDVETLHYTIFTENQNYFANGLLSGNRFTKKLSKGVE